MAYSKDPMLRKLTSLNVANGRSELTRAKRIFLLRLFALIMKQWFMSAREPMRPQNTRWRLSADFTACKQLYPCWSKIMTGRSAMGEIFGIYRLGPA